MNTTCAVCLESFTSSCEVSSTPCGHLFHSNCLSKSVTGTQNTCPTCRQNCGQNIHRVYLQGELGEQLSTQQSTQQTTEQPQMPQDDQTPPSPTLSPSATRVAVLSAALKFIGKHRQNQE